MSEELNNSEDFLARWLSGELTPEEQSEFEGSEAAKEFKAIVDSVEKISLPEYDVERGLALLKAKRINYQEKQAKVVRFPAFVRYAAAAVVIFAITLTYFLTRPDYVTYETLAGEIEHITLPDQSTIVLNANSSVRFDPDKFDVNRRILLKGEAFFEVTKGINFQVETDQGTVKVLGTSFNVWNRKDLLDVVCFTGKVNVSKRSYSKDLTPGDGVRLENGNFKRSWKKPLEGIQPSWVSLGITELDNVTLREALDELIHVYGISVTSTKELDDIPYTGSFPNNDVESAIRLVLLPDNIEYTYDTTSKTLVLQGIKGE